MTQGSDRTAACVKELETASLSIAAPGFVYASRRNWGQLYNTVHDMNAVAQCDDMFPMDGLRTHIAMIHCYVRCSHGSAENLTGRMPKQLDNAGCQDDF